MFFTCSFPFQLDCPFILYTYYSSLSISVIHDQLQKDRKKHPVAYAIQYYHDTETNLCSSKGELLAIVFVVSKFHHFLAGVRFTLVIDNATLTYLESSKGRTPKLDCWAIVFAYYDL